MSIVIDNEEYLQQKLEWIQCRLGELDQVESKLIEMRQLAEYARNNTLSCEKIKELTVKINKLQQEVIAMDEHSKTFWLDNQ